MNHCFLDPGDGKVSASLFPGKPDTSHPSKVHGRPTEDSILLNEEGFFLIIRISLEAWQKGTAEKASLTDRRVTLKSVAGVPGPRDPSSVREPLRSALSLKIESNRACKAAFELAFRTAWV